MRVLIDLEIKKKKNGTIKEENEEEEMIKTSRTSKSAKSTKRRLTVASDSKREINIRKIKVEQWKKRVRLNDEKANSDVDNKIR